MRLLHFSEKESFWPAPEKTPSGADCAGCFFYVDIYDNEDICDMKRLWNNRYVSIWEAPSGVIEVIDDSRHRGLRMIEVFIQSENFDKLRKIE